MILMERVAGCWLLVAGCARSDRRERNQQLTTSNQQLPYFFCNLPNNTDANTKFTEFPAQMRPRPNWSGGLDHFVTSTLRSSGTLPATRWPATINVIVTSAGMKLTANALRKFPLRNIMPSA